MRDGPVSHSSERAPPNANSVTYTLNAADPGGVNNTNFGRTPPGSCPQ